MVSIAHILDISTFTTFYIVKIRQEAIANNELMLLIRTSENDEAKRRGENGIKTTGNAPETHAIDYTVKVEKFL